MSLKESYERIYGKDLNWENIDDFLKLVLKDHQKNISKKYVGKTTLVSSGQFIGDRRIVDLISNYPLNITI